MAAVTGTIEVYVSHSLVPTPSDADKVIFYKLSTDSKLYMKNSSAVSTEVGGAGFFNLVGTVDCSTNPNYSASQKGDAYVVSVAGKIGGGSGVEVVAGDFIICITDSAAGNQATVGANFKIIEANINSTTDLTVNSLSATAGVDTSELTVSSTADIAGNFAIATNKFTVNATTGSTLVAGNLSVTGAIAVNTNKFNVTAATGNLAINVDKFIVAGDTGAVSQKGNLSIQPDGAITPKFSVAAATGNTVIKGQLDVDGSINTVSGNISSGGDLQVANDTFLSGELWIEGSQGVDFSGAITNLTVVNGIVTAAS